MLLFNISILSLFILFHTYLHLAFLQFCVLCNAGFNPLLCHAWEEKKQQLLQMNESMAGKKGPEMSEGKPVFFLHWDFERRNGWQMLLHYLYETLRFLTEFHVLIVSLQIPFWHDTVAKSLRKELRTVIYVWFLTGAGQNNILKKRTTTLSQFSKTGVSTAVGVYITWILYLISDFLT